MLLHSRAKRSARAPTGLRSEVNNNKMLNKILALFFFFFFFFPLPENVFILLSSS